MRRIKSMFNPLVFVAIIAVVAGLGFVTSGSSGSKASAETPQSYKEESPYAPPAPMSPKQPPVTSTTTPEQPTETAPSPDIRTIPVTTWGTKVVNDKGTLSLQARNTEPGDLPETVQVNFDLCALVDVVIADQDTGDYDTTIGTIRFPEDGILDGKDDKGGYEQYSLPAVVIVDNTPMVNQVIAEPTNPGDAIQGEVGDLMPVLRKGTCTTASLEVKKDDRSKMAVGFLYWTDPFGEFRIGGGVTQLAKQGPASVSYEYEIN